LRRIYRFMHVDAAATCGGTGAAGNVLPVKS
jgi:hypothetical protein